MLVIYFAGFATAIYFLVPAPENGEFETSQSTVDASVFKSDQFAQSFSTSLHKCLDFGKSVAAQAGGLLKQKLAESSSETEADS